MYGIFTYTFTIKRSTIHVGIKNIGYFFGTFAAMMLQKELGISTKAQGLRLRTNLQSVSALLKNELAHGCPRNLG